MNVHFYFKGDDFQFLNRLAVLSHVLVGHKVIMWADGEINSPYWIDDIPEIEIREAREVLEGPEDPKEIRAFSDKVISVRGVKHGKLVITGLVED